MSICLTSISGQKILNDSLFVIYDLEFIGPLNHFHEARIWEIAANIFNQDGTVEFHRICFPMQKDVALPLQHKPYFEVSSDFLIENNAVNKNKALHDFLQFLQGNAARYGKTNIILISHGNMKSDKIVLENEYKRCADLIPSNIYFFDTLPFFRKTFRTLQRYDLLSIYHHIHLGKSNVQKHRAAEDVHMLLDIFNSSIKYKNDIPVLDGVICPAYLTPLQNLKGIGNAGEKQLMLMGISTVEQLSQVANTHLYNISKNNTTKTLRDSLRKLQLPYVACDTIALSLLAHMNEQLTLNSVVNK